MRKYLLAFIGLFLGTLTYGQDCSDETIEVVLKVITDQWTENAWILGSGDSIYTSVKRTDYLDTETFLDTFCVGSLECLTFTITDGFGDGIVDGGGFEIYVAGDLIIKENEFGLSASYEVNCLPGTSCLQADSIGLGDHIAPQRNSWYRFTADTIGTYTISTCGNNSCDTRIWVYDRCESFVPGSLEGFIFFDDNAGNCGNQAVVNAFFDVGDSYLIRISDTEGDCNGPINWSINYQGPVIGCTDSTSCNFNPLATIDDGSCLPQGDPLCPNGPDLSINNEVLFSSIEVDSIFTDTDCWLKEGCLTGVGMREIIRFTTRFENIGELDYYIGRPEIDNDQFVFDECHNHFHYENYSEYLLYDAQGGRIPSGFKSGFCVIDLNCPTGNNKYGCNNMGLSVGCYDEYSSELDCQWIDVTDIPDGDITFVARINWRNQPDALGRVEKNLENNWAQVCMTLDRSTGGLSVTLNEDCPIITDCEGTAYGNVFLDCTGLCGGNTIVGDINNSSIQDKADVQSYVSAILDEETLATPCNDLNSDEKLTVYDAALLSDCVNFENGHLHPNNELHSHCNFPYGFINTNHLVNLEISEVNDTEKYLDIAIKNPDTDIVGYQFTISGVQIQQIESLVDILQFPAMLQANMSTGEIIGLSLQDSTIEKSRDFQPLLRIHFTSFTADFVCLESISDVVNRSYQQTMTEITNNCIDISTDLEEIAATTIIKIQPNPFKQTTIISFPNPNQEQYSLLISDLSGRTIKRYDDVRNEYIKINRDGLPNGLYYFQLIGETQTLTGKLVVQ